MKISDDYRAKLEFWAKNPKVHPALRITDLPHFGHRRFNSYEEMNEWKKGILDQLAKEGGAKWST